MNMKCIRDAHMCGSLILDSVIFLIPIFLYAFFPVWSAHVKNAHLQVKKYYFKKM